MTRGNTDAVLGAARSLVDQVRRMLGDQLELVGEEMGRLERALEHLDGTGDKAAPPRGRKAPHGKAKSKEEWEHQIVAELRKAPGTIGDLTLRLGLNRGVTTLFAPARSARVKGLVQKDGSVYSLPKEPSTPKPRRRGASKSRSETKAKGSASKSR